MIDHTADFGIHVFAADVEALYTNAVVAMFDLLTNIDLLAGREQIDLKISGDDRADLMVNWLREALYLWNGREMLVKTALIQSVTQHYLSARVLFDPYDADRHVIKTEIKAVTYHQIQVYRNPSGWEAKIIFDI